jgi:hypothetical protein
MDSKRRTSPKVPKRTSSPRTKGAQTVLAQDGSGLASAATPSPLDAATTEQIGMAAPVMAAQKPAEPRAAEPPSKGRRILGYETDWQQWDQLAEQLGEKLGGQKNTQALVLHHLLQMAQSQLPASGPTKSETSSIKEEAPLSPERILAELAIHIPQLLSTMTSLTVQFQQNQQQQNQLNLLLAQILETLTSSGNPELLGDLRQLRRPSATSAIAKDHFTTLDSQNLKKSHAKGSAEEKLKRAFDAIVAHNEMPSHAHENKWAINQNALAELTGCNRPAIKHFLRSYGAEIERHHQANELLPRHNYAHGKLGVKITDIISW